MRIGSLFIALLMLIAPVARAADGMVVLPSAHPVSITVDRLAAALKAQGFRIFARIDHAAGAASVDMTLAPTELLIFGMRSTPDYIVDAAEISGLGRGRWRGVRGLE